MKKTIDGVTYKQHKVNKGCYGCVADGVEALCHALIKAADGCNLSWKMVKAKGPLQVGSNLKIDGVRYVAHAEEVEGRCDGCAGDGKGPCGRLIDKAGKKFSNTEDGMCGEYDLIWKREGDQPVEPEPVEVAPFAVVAFKGKTYDVVPELSEWACDGCAFAGKPCEKVNDELERLTGKRCGGADVIFKLREAAPPVEGRIEWAGGECPVDPCTLVEVEVRDRVKDTRLAGEYWWDHVLDVPGADIVRYRVIKAPDAPTTQTVMVSFTFPADIARGTVEGYVQNIVRTAINGTPRDKDAHALLMNWDIE